MTMTMKPIPKAKVSSVNRFLSMVIFLEYIDEEERSSEVISNIIAITATQRPKSCVDRGKSILFNSNVR